MGWNDLIPTETALVTPHAMYCVLGGFITVFGLLSLVVKERLFMSEAMVAVLVGVAVGPLAAHIFVAGDVFGASLPVVTLEFTRVVVAIQVMACGVDLPGSYLYREWRSVALLCGPVMAVKWLVSAAGIYCILDALVIGACITPTDPVLANSIVKGRFAEKHVPLNVRLILAAERCRDLPPYHLSHTGANDGLGTPFLLLAIYLQRLPVGEAIGTWTWKVLIYQILLSSVIGIILATIARKILKKAERSRWMDKESILSFSIAFALFLMGFVSLIGSDDIFAVFVAGNILTWDLWFNEKVSYSSFQEVIDALLNLAYFVYIGAIMPWSSFNGDSSSSDATGVELWRLVLLAMWVLFLRRVPVVMAMSPWIPALKDWREALFAGWFGPIGAGAIFYAYIAVIYFEVPAYPIMPIVNFIVLSSVLVHGGSVALFNMSMNRSITYQQWESRRKLHTLPTVTVRAEDIVILRDVDAANGSVLEQVDTTTSIKRQVSFVGDENQDGKNSGREIGVPPLPPLSQASRARAEADFDSNSVGPAISAAGKGVSEDSVPVDAIDFGGSKNNDNGGDVGNNGDFLIVLDSDDAGNGSNSLMHSAHHNVEKIDNGEKDEFLGGDSNVKDSNGSGSFENLKQANHDAVIDIENAKGGKKDEDLVRSNVEDSSISRSGGGGDSGGKNSKPEIHTEDDAVDMDNTEGGKKEENFVIK
ncbi:hypothetical protein HK100_005424 [Physocladia obscura]|uniref:Cation/H+ exchanger transmembrane domain-containing protein n=1 Tax=Physocladia obscura TaxID=109957 RepID=A0AAD5SU61_9FUNG|nr:hypothetical protein HK100_005424 [Physocladia obscura]